ncbi:MAG: metal ABC transporter substrate-binding protein [Oscillospiraceae bacterium]
MRKRLVSLALALLLCLSLAACGGEARQEDSGKLQIVATLFPYYDMARAIAGDRAEVTLLISAGRESHSYEPTPLDVIRIGEADLFLYNGGTDETWASEVLSSMDHGRAIAMMEQVEKREEELAEGMQAERGHDHDHEEGDDHDHGDEDGHALEIEYDEHIWTSPVNAMTIAAVIAEALTELDGAGADCYAANLEIYLAELQALDEAFRETVAQGSRNLIVLGDRFPLLYFCEEYGLSYRAAFLGCSTETEPSAATMAYLIDRVREEKIPVVYYLENSSGRVAEAIAEATGAEPVVFCSCQSVTPEDFRAGETYLSLMWRNVEVLQKGLA